MNASTHIINPIDPSTNPAIAKPGESSFLIPILPQIIATTEVISGRYHKITTGIGMKAINADDNPIIPKTNETIPRALPIFLPPWISILEF